MSPWNDLPSPTVCEGTVAINYLQTSFTVFSNSYMGLVVQ